MTTEEFVFNIKQRLNQNIKSHPADTCRAIVIPYQDCKQYKMKDLISEASKYGPDFVIEKAIHFPTFKTEHNQYKKQGGIIAYYKSDMKEWPFKN